MRQLLILIFLAFPVFAQVGNNCSTNTSAATGTIQSYGFCIPGVISGRNAGGWIALNRSGDQSNGGEQECYDPSNIVIQNGLLTILYRKESRTCHYFPAQTGVGNFSGLYSSAFVQWNTFSFTGGTVMVRMKGPSAANVGAWPAIVLYGKPCQPAQVVTADNTTFNGQTCNWPTTGEIDIFEQTGGGTTTSNCTYFDSGGSHNPTTQYTISGGADTNFHIYELRWVAGGSIQWYLDGVHQAACDGSSTGLTGPMFLNLNIASNNASSATPSNMQIDWVKVCKSTTGCNGNGGDIIFYDDFLPPVTQTLFRPLARAARTFASTGSPSNFNLQINGQVVVSGQTVMQ